MADHLAGLTTGSSKSSAVHDVIETRLEDLQQDVTSLTLGAVSLLVVTTELLLQDAVGVTSLLLLAQLQRVLGVFGATASVDTRGYGRRSKDLSLPTRSVPRRRDFLVRGPV